MLKICLPIVNLIFECFAFHILLNEEITSVKFVKNTWNLVTYMYSESTVTIFNEKYLRGVTLHQGSRDITQVPTRILAQILKL